MTDTKKNKKTAKKFDLPKLSDIIDLETGQAKDKVVPDFNMDEKFVVGKASSISSKLEKQLSDSVRKQAPIVDRNTFPEDIKDGWVRKLINDSTNGNGKVDLEKIDFKSLFLISDKHIKNIKDHLQAVYENLLRLQTQIYGDSGIDLMSFMEGSIECLDDLLENLKLVLVCLKTMEYKKTLDNEIKLSDMSDDSSKIGTIEKVKEDSTSLVGDY